MNKQTLHYLKGAACVVAFSSTPKALVTSEMNDLKPLKVSFSQRDTNRVTIENGRIAQVFGTEELMAIQFDEENGQCFVKAKSHPGHPITLTVITESGETQDLEITFKDVASEVVVLRSIKSTDTLPPDDGGDPLIEVMKWVLQGKLPKGVRFKPLETHKTIAVQKGLERQLTHVLQHGEYRVDKGTIKNTTGTALRLHESKVSVKGDVAIYIKDRTLVPNQSTYVLVVRKRGR